MLGVADEAERRGRGAAAVRPRACVTRLALLLEADEVDDVVDIAGRRVVAGEEPEALATVRFGYIADDWRTIADRARASSRPPARDRCRARVTVAGVAAPVALEDLDRRRLAGAVRPEQAEHLALWISKSRRAPPRGRLRLLQVADRTAAIDLSGRYIRYRWKICQSLSDRDIILGFLRFGPRAAMTSSSRSRSRRGSSGARASGRSIPSCAVRTAGAGARSRQKAAAAGRRTDSQRPASTRSTSGFAATATSSSTATRAAPPVLLRLHGWGGRARQCPPDARAARGGRLVPARRDPAARAGGCRARLPLSATRARVGLCG